MLSLHQILCAACKGVLPPVRLLERSAMAAELMGFQHAESHRKSSQGIREIKSEMVRTTQFENETRWMPNRSFRPNSFAHRVFKTSSNLTAFCTVSRCSPLAVGSRPNFSGSGFVAARAGLGLSCRFPNGKLFDQLIRISPPIHRYCLIRSFRWPSQSLRLMPTLEV